MSPTPQSSNDREGTTGEPPPLVKYFIWLLDRRNWVKHRTAIAIGVIVIAVIGGLDIVPKILNRDSKTAASTENATHNSFSNPAPESENHVGLLSDDDAMLAIQKALDRGDVSESIKLVSLMKEGLVKMNECEHVYDYTIKYEKLEEAKSVVGLCWEGESREKKLAEILHESLKK